MKVLYLAGPYRAPSVHLLTQNIRAAEYHAKDVWILGQGKVAVISPHLNSGFFDGLLPDEVWLEAGLEMVRRSDAIGLFGGWRHSKGAIAELTLAAELGIPAFSFPEDGAFFREWVRGIDWESKYRKLLYNNRVISKHKLAEFYPIG